YGGCLVNLGVHVRDHDEAIMLLAVTQGPHRRKSVSPTRHPVTHGQNGGERWWPTLQGRDDH
ncbi:MAG: hypothetical protein M3443_21040, partial [Actinomycetota bacterium]|nr:hypothetical protein [Actinomycetota bacterium]